MTVIWSYPTRILFGAGASAEVKDEALRLGMKRALLVSDKGVSKAGLCDGIRQVLEAGGIACELFDAVASNPTERNIEDGAAAFKAHGADGLVCVGGGSPMDAGKLIAVRVRTSRSFEELDDAHGGMQHVPSELPPLITIPTTAGTGSEVGRAGVLTVEATKLKTVVFAPQMMPKVAILDPELTRSMPKTTTAATGFDALTHCIEAYLAKGDHPMADAIALAGIDLVAKSLPAAVANGADLEARGAMMKAAMMGAVAFQKGLGACHSLAHPLSSDHDLHHGLANALCLPSVLGFNEQAVPERVLHVGLLLGGEAGAGAAAQAVRQLRALVGLPNGLKAVGLTEGLLPALADKALLDGCHHGNPRSCTRDDLLAMYRASL